MQDIIELDNKKMQVVKEIADMNMKVGEVRGELQKLTDDKDKFIAFRENEVLGRIHKLLNDSRILLDETNGNYTLVNAFYQDIKAFCDFVFKGSEAVEAYIADFEKNGTKIIQALEKHEDAIKKQRHVLKIQTDTIERDKKFIATKLTEIEKGERRLESKAQAIKTSYERLQRLWETIPDEYKAGQSI